jgi:hypothetical protein
LYVRLKKHQDVVVKKITFPLKLVLESIERVEKLTPEELILGKGSGEESPNTLLNP